MLELFFKTFIFLFSLSLLLYGLSYVSFWDMVKMDIGFLGASILIAYFWPSLRGVKRGDYVSVVRGNMPRIFGSVGTALTDAKLGKEIRVKLDSGKEIVGILESYSGILSKPKVRLLYEEREKEDEYEI